MKPVKLGRMTIRKIFEMESGPPMPLIVPGVTAEHLARLATWHTDNTLGPTPEQSAFMMSMHSYVLQVDGATILVDACNGNHKQRSIPDVNQAETPFLANLAAVGLTTDDVDLVLCTHLHFDHVGWNTRLENGRWVPTSPTPGTCFRAATSSTSGSRRSKTTMYAPSAIRYSRCTRPVAPS